MLRQQMRNATCANDAPTRRRALQFHETVVGHRIREVTPEVDTDKVQVVVLEIGLCSLFVPKVYIRAKKESHASCVTLSKSPT